jgi:hypothetical protein
MAWLIAASANSPLARARPERAAARLNAGSSWVRTIRSASFSASSATALHRQRAACRCAARFDQREAGARCIAADDRAGCRGDQDRAAVGDDLPDIEANHRGVVEQVQRAGVKVDRVGVERIIQREDGAGVDDRGIAGVWVATVIDAADQRPLARIVPTARSGGPGIGRVRQGGFPRVDTCSVLSGVGTNA